MEHCTDIKPTINDSETRSILSQSEAPRNLLNTADNGDHYNASGPIDIQLVKKETINGSLKDHSETSSMETKPLVDLIQKFEMVQSGDPRDFTMPPPGRLGNDTINESIISGFVFQRDGHEWGRNRRAPIKFFNREGRIRNSIRRSTAIWLGATIFDYKTPFPKKGCKLVISVKGVEITTEFDVIEEPGCFVSGEADSFFKGEDVNYALISDEVAKKIRSIQHFGRYYELRAGFAIYDHAFGDTLVISLPT